MPKIFLSYRRVDSQADARHLRQALRGLLPHFQILRDINDIPPGADFAEYINRSIAECDAVLVLIGPSWDAVAADGKSRLGRDDDVVRMEVAAALRLDKLTVPVLLYGTPMPDRSRLPPDLARLTMLNAVSLQDQGWDSDVAQLAQWLRKLLPLRHSDGAQGHASPPPRPAAGPQVSSTPAVKTTTASAKTPARPSARVPSHPDRSVWMRPLVLVMFGVPSVLYLLLLALNLIDEDPLPTAIPSAEVVGEVAPAWRALERTAESIERGVSACANFEKWDCLEAAKSQEVPLLARNSEPMRAYAALRIDGTALAPRQPAGSYETALEIRYFGPYLKASSHALAWAALDAQSGRMAEAWFVLTEEIIFHRRISASAGDSFARLVSARRLQAALRLVDEVLGFSLPQGDAQLAMQLALQPMVQAEMDILRIVDHETRIDLISVATARAALRRANPAFSDNRRDVARAFGYEGEVPSLVPFEWDLLNLAAYPLFLPESTSNHFRAMHELNRKLVSLSPGEFAKPGSLFDYLQAVGVLRAKLAGPSALYNPAGKRYIRALLAGQKMDGDQLPWADQLFTETHDLDAYIRLLSAKLKIRQRSLGRAAIPAFLAEEAAGRGPYDGKPLVYDEQNHTLNTPMMGRLRSVILSVSLELRNP